MDKNVLWHLEKRVERTVNNLKKRNMAGFFVKDETGLKGLLKELIAPNSVVGVGDSMTLNETGVIEFLREGDYVFLDDRREGITNEERGRLYTKNFSADTFMCSTNALTEEGELYNIDGDGNRVAAMVYGPRQVIIVAGVNKIVRDIEEAEKRVRNYSAPIDAKRFDLKTPCATLGYCTDCRSQDRICNAFSIIRGQSFKDRIKVIIVGKSLGY